MLLTKPSWVHNDGNPIFSIDIHPDGLRFATGGQGKDSGRVAIWNLASVSMESVSEDENIPKLLCQLDNHLSCVNCVRWSHSGQYLASGGDDKLVMVWKLSGEPRVNETGILSGVEQWRSVATLTGHSNDVLDLAWAYHDMWLATCSVDNSVIVWNMGRTPPDMLQRLTGHTGLVKGVTWDPVGEYLASQSDDKTLRVWRTSDWKEQASISEPFKQCGDMTHVLRLNWSPDGAYLVSAHASNSGGPTARIIEVKNRPIVVESDSCEMDFVGHRKAVTCVKFNPNLLYKIKTGDGKQTKYCVLATGSRDCSVAIWCTSRRRPITVVLDLSWSKDGMQLMVCSWDGSVAHFRFTEKILGFIASEGDKNATLQNLYGKSFATRHLPNKEMVPIVEFTSVLKKGKETKPVVEETNRPSQQPRSRPVAPEGPTIEDVLSRSEQIETRTADGKRRITPITVPRDCIGVSGPTFSVSSGAKTKIKVVKRNEISASSSSSSQNQRSASKPITLAEKSESLVPVKTPEIRTTFVPAEVSTEKMKRSTVLNMSNTGMNNMRLTAKVLPIHIQSGATASIEGEDRAIIEIFNSKENSFGSVKKILTKGDGSGCCWQTDLGNHVVAVRSNKQYTMVISSDHKLHALDTRCGSYMLPPLKISGLPVAMELSGNFFSVITTTWSLFVWNLESLTMTMALTNLDEHLIDGEGSGNEAGNQIVNLTLNEGRPLVTLACGNTYVYSNAGWTVVFDAYDKVAWVASQSQIVQNVLSTKSVGSKFNLLRSISNAKRSFFMKKFKDTSYDNRTCTCTFLEKCLKTAFIMDSARDYKDYLSALVQYAVSEGMISYLETIIRNLFEDKISSGWRYEKLKITKMELLLLIENSLKSNLICQRLYNEFLSTYLEPETNHVKEAVSPTNETKSSSICDMSDISVHDQEIPKKDNIISNGLKNQDNTTSNVTSHITEDSNAIKIKQVSLD